MIVRILLLSFVFAGIFLVPIAADDEVVKQNIIRQCERANLFYNKNCDCKMFEIWSPTFNEGNGGCLETFENNQVTKDISPFEVQSGGIIDLDTNGDINLQASLVNIFNLIFGLLAILAILLIIYGGWIYITAQGDDDIVARASSTMKNAVFGLIVAIIAAVFVNVIANITGFVPQDTDLDTLINSPQNNTQKDGEFFRDLLNL